MILFAAEHTAGATSVLQVGKKLEERGHAVRLIAGTDAAEDVFRTAGQVYERKESAQEVLANYPNPEALVTSMCSTQGVIVGLIQALKGKCPRIALQGAGGGGLEPGWLLSENRPDYVCVQDVVLQEEFAKRWAEFAPERIVITGLPVLDPWINYEIASAQEEVNRVLALSPYQKVVLFVGQLEWTSRELLDLVAALNSLVRSVYLIAREHPRFRTHAFQEVDAWEHALNEFTNGVLIDTGEWRNTRVLVARADVVVGRTSNVLVEAAFLRKPVIAMISPFITEELKRTTGRDTWPWAENGSMAKVTSEEELLAALSKALDGELDLSAGQQRAFARDGKTASERVADFVLGLIS